MANGYTRQSFGASPALGFLTAALKAGTGSSTRENLQVKQLADYEYKQMQKKEGIELFKAHEDLGLFNDDGTVDPNRVNMLLSPPGAKTYTQTIVDDKTGEEKEVTVPLVSKDNEDKKLFQRLLKYRLSKMPGAGKTLNVESGEEEDFEFNRIQEFTAADGTKKYNLFGNKYDKSGKFLGIFPVTKLRTNSDSDIVAVYDQSQIISLLEDSRRQAINQGGADTIANRVRSAKLLYNNYKDPAVNMVGPLEEAIRDLPRDSEATKTIMMETVKQAAATGDVDHLRKEVLEMGIDEAVFNEALADAIKESEAAKAIAANQIEDTTAGKASVVKTDAEGNPVTAGTESGLPENEIDEENTKLAEAKTLQVKQSVDLFLPTIEERIPQQGLGSRQIKSYKIKTVIDPKKDIRNPKVGATRKDGTPLYTDEVISKLSEEFADNIDLKDEFRASLAQDRVKGIPRGTTFANKYNLEEELTKAGFVLGKRTGDVRGLLRQAPLDPQEEEIAKAADAVSGQFLGDDPENMAARDAYEAELERRRQPVREEIARRESEGNPLTETEIEERLKPKNLFPEDERRRLLGEAGAFGLPMLDRVGGAPETGTGPRRVAAFSANFTDDARGAIEASYQQGIEALKVDPNNPEVLGRVEEFMKGYLESGIPLEKFKPGSPDARRVSANLEANNVRTAKDLSSMSRPEVIEAAAMLWANLPAAQRTPDNLAKFQNLAVTGDPTKSGYVVAAEGTARSIAVQNANTNQINAIRQLETNRRTAVEANALTAADNKILNRLSIASQGLPTEGQTFTEKDWTAKRKALQKELNVALALLRRKPGLKNTQAAGIIRQEINVALPSYLAMLNNEFALDETFSWFNEWFADTVDVSKVGGVAQNIRIIRPDIANDPTKISEIKFFKNSGKENLGSVEFSELKEKVSQGVLNPFIDALIQIDNLRRTQTQAQE